MDLFGISLGLGIFCSFGYLLDLLYSKYKDKMETFIIFSPLIMVLLIGIYSLGSEKKKEIKKQNLNKTKIEKEVKSKKEKKNKKQNKKKENPIDVAKGCSFCL